LLAHALTAPKGRGKVYISLIDFLLWPQALQPEQVSLSDLGSIETLIGDEGSNRARPRRSANFTPLACQSEM